MTDKMIKQNVIQIFEELFTISSIKLIELSEKNYKQLSQNEKYFEEDKDLIE